jgi:hypothetical protein
MRPLPRPAPSAPATDRTTLLVRLGLIALALLGVVAVFGEPLLGISAPSAEIGSATIGGESALPAAGAR